MDYKKLNYDITDVIVRSLHQIDKFQRNRNKSFNETKAEMELLESEAVAMYRNDAVYHAKVQMIVSRLLEVIRSNDVPNI